MMRISSYVFAIAGLTLLMVPRTVSGQQIATDVSAALNGVIIVPGVQISFAGDTTNRKYENNQTGATPVKTYIYPDGREKFFIEDSILKGFLHLGAEYPRFWDIGTKFKVTAIKLEKQDIELLLTPLSGGSDVGDVKLMLGADYSAKSTPELVAQINQILKVGTVEALKPPAATSSASSQVALDCVPNQDMVDNSLTEVVFDEGSRTATFQTVGKPKPMQPAVFTDAQIEWNNGLPGTNREFYSLSRSNGVLAIKNTDTTMARITGRSNLNHVDTMLFTCSVRTKKF